MVKKFSKAAEKSSQNELLAQLKDSSAQIWLAGLGAFAKAQEEGGKVFEALVKEGMNLQKKVKRFTDSQVSEVSQEVSGRINEATQKAAGAWDRLEAVFEERVGRAVSRLGVPSKADITALTAKVEALTQQVAKMNASPSRSTTAQAKANGTAAVKEAKKVVARTTKSASKKVKAAVKEASN